MKMVMIALHFTFSIVEALTQILLAPMTIFVALGFVVFTAIIGRQFQPERGQWWIRAGQKFRMGA